MAALRTTAKKKGRSGVKAALKKKGMPRGKPFEPGNEFAFPPGQSGNPGGRPKLLTEAYRERLEAEVEAQPDLTYAQAIARAVVVSALDGNLSAVSELRIATEKAERPGEKRLVEVSDDELYAILGIPAPGSSSGATQAASGS